MKFIIWLFLCQIPEDPNMIKENYEEYIVEFTVTIVDPTYSKLLRDTEAPQYNDITQELTDKVRAECAFPDPQQMLTVL